MASSEIEKFVKKANICFLKDFLDAAVKCGELTELGKERLKKNKALKEFFDEGRDEMVETLEDTVRELATLKKKIKGDGLEYLLEDYGEDAYKGLLEKCSDDFIQISEFRGIKEGYTFKTDSQGTGYYKDDVVFDESSSDSSEEDGWTECETCHRVWDGNAQCPCGMDMETFEGRTTFPSEPSEETNQFIIRYISAKWQPLTYSKLNYGDEVAWRITRSWTTGPNPPNYTLNGKGSCGIMSMDSDWGREGFILDLKGKEFKIINNFLMDLIHM